MERRAGARAGWWTTAVLAVLGLGCIVAGIGMRTVWAPPTTYRATVDVPAGTPVVVTAPGVPEMFEGPVEVRADGAPSQNLLIARGREADVQAWIGSDEAATITGLAAPHRLSLATSKGGTQLPDPATSQLWVDSVTSKGHATYAYRQTTGRYVLLFGTAGGPGAPSRVSLTWSQQPGVPWAWPLVAAGSILLLSALVLTVRRFGAARRAAAAEVSGTLRPKVSLVKSKVSLVKPGAATTTLPALEREGRRTGRGQVDDAPETSTVRRVVDGPETSTVRRVVDGPETSRVSPGTQAPSTGEGEQR